MTNKPETLNPCRCGNKELVPIQVCESVEKPEILYAEIKCWECGFFMQLPTYDDVAQAWNICNAAKPAPEQDLAKEIAMFGKKYADWLDNGAQGDFEYHSVWPLLVKCEAVLSVIPNAQVDNEIEKFEKLFEMMGNVLTVNQWEQIFDIAADLEIDTKHFTKYETNNLKA